MSAQGHYNKVGVAKPQRTAFDLSHVRTFDCNQTQLVPVFMEDCIPGDKWQVSVRPVIRSQPLVVPLYTRLHVYLHYFFVPYRILDKNWEKFITGGQDGTVTIPPPYMIMTDRGSPSVGNTSGWGRRSLWSYFGFPFVRHDGTVPPTGETWVDPTDSGGEIYNCEIVSYPWLAYWMIWREYYRDENMMLHYPYGSNPSTNQPIPIGEDDEEKLRNLGIFVYESVGYGTSDPLDPDFVYSVPSDLVANRCWRKDYFTSALPNRQQGIAPLIPIVGTSSALWNNTRFIEQAGAGSNIGITGAAPNSYMFGNPGSGATVPNMLDFFNANEVDLSLVTGVDWHYLRAAGQLTKFLERSARVGNRYIEFLRGHFMVSPRDERLNRPEYLGGLRDVVMTTEVLQTSSDSSAPTQGNVLGRYAGHGMAVSGGRAFSRTILEHGIIMGIMSIMPESLYQQGVDRQWMPETRFDYYSPEFAHISEQEIALREIFYQPDEGAGPRKMRFGFQGAWDQYRTRRNLVIGTMTNDLRWWTLSRIFDNPPRLNASFLSTYQHMRNRREAWAVTSNNIRNGEGQFLCEVRHDVVAVRPLPYIGDPGLVDHF